MATSGPGPVADLIRHVPDFPQPGVGFKDISPLLGSPAGFAEAVAAMVAASPDGIDLVLAVEARGFVFGAPVALGLGAGLVLVRKPGKLPMATIDESYDLEYGSNTLAVHADAITAGARVLLVDDVLATGGTAVAAVRLAKRLGATVVGTTVLMELAFLGGREALLAAGSGPVAAVVRYDEP